MTLNTYREGDAMHVVVLKSDDAGVTWYPDVTGGGGVTSVDGLTGAVTLTSRYQRSMTPTATKTATTYSAGANEFIPVSTASNAVTVTLPNAPADRTVVEVRMVAQGGTNAVTINTAGTDVFSVSGGATSATLTALGEAFHMQYASSTGLWHILGKTPPRTEQLWQQMAPAVSANDNFMQVKSSAWISRTPAQARTDLFPAWTAYTPTVTQGATFTLTSNNSRYMQFGKTVVGVVRCVLGSTGTANSPIRATMPVTGFYNGASINPAAGTGTFFDASTGERSKFWVQNNSDGSFFQFFPIHFGSEAVSYELGDAQLPGPQGASGDVLTFFFMYEAA